MGRSKSWTEKEKEFLEDQWGKLTLPGLAKKLGRTEQAIKLKARRLGMGDARQHYNGFTLHSLATILGIDYKKIVNWVDRYDFPVKEKAFVREKVMVVSEKDFWKWAEANKEMIDFSKVESNTFGLEPQWMKDKRNADIIKARKIKKANETHWSDEEDKILIGMLKAMCYTYTDIARRINRSEGGIKVRIQKLKLKLRPVKAQKVYPDELVNRPNNNFRKPYTNEEKQLIRDMCKAKCTIIEIDKALGSERSFSSLKNQVKKLGVKPQPMDEYTDEQVNLIVTLLGKGHSIADIAERVDRTANGVRGKLERMGYHFKNGVPIPPQPQKTFEEIMMERFEQGDKYETDVHSSRTRSISVRE